MKRTTWINQDDEILFVENVKPFELPRIGESIIYAKHYMTIKNIEHNFDKNEVKVFVEFK